MGEPAGWDFLKEFRWRSPSVPATSWDAAEKLAGLARRELLEHVTEVERAVKEWDQHLKEYGGDPVCRDWSTFRPLRLSREEDWSDWLAFLLQESVTGLLGATIFGGKVARYVKPASVRREWSLRRDFRADLGIQLADQKSWLHVEVKVGDEDFEKTFDECAPFRQAIGGEPEVRDFILLPSTSMTAWTEAANTQRSKAAPPPVEVVAVTWDQVAIGIRRSLRRKREGAARESLQWCAWAYAFVGAIEQRLLGVPRLGPKFDAGAHSLSALAGLSAFAKVLADGDIDE